MTKNVRVQTTWAATALAAALLAGCRGGGGSDPSGTSSNPQQGSNSAPLTAMQACFQLQ